MANWWDAAPVAQEAVNSSSGGNWWDAAPVAGNYNVAREDGVTKITPKKEPSVSMPEAVARGAAQGVSANFYDELRGLVEASGANPRDPASLGALVQGAYKYWSGDKEAGQRYDEATKRERAQTKQAEEDRPYSSLAGNVAGAVALPVGEVLNGATMGARALRSAAVGAGYGGLAGAGDGEGAADTAMRAGAGVGLGAVAGGIAAPVVEGATRLAGAIAAPIANTVRGVFRPGDEAARMAAGTMQRDIAADPQALRRLTPQEVAATPQATLMDAGGDITRRLADAANIVSRDGSTALNQAINARYEGQTPRIVEYLNNTYHFPNAFSQQEAIEQAAKGVNAARYKKAYEDPNGAALWDEGFEQLSQAPAVQDAIRKATITGADKAARQGFTPIRNPFVMDPATQRMVLRTGPDGNPIALPNIQFWDTVKRNLDQVGSFDARDFSRVLRGHIDDLVPAYKEARAGAAHFFGAENALEAGQNFVSATFENRATRAAIAKFTPVERQLFKDGFVSRVVESIENKPDRRNILNNIAATPAAREKMEMVLGNQGWRDMEATLRVEGIMDLPRQMIQGNSWTTRRLYDAGMLGGGMIGANGGYDMDPHKVGFGALVSALAFGGKKANERVMTRVAQMLVSRDPVQFQRGLNIVSRNNDMMAGLRSYDRRVSAITSEQLPTGLAVQAGGVGHADQGQQQVPGPVQP